MLGFLRNMFRAPQDEEAACEELERARAADTALKDCWQRYQAAEHEQSALAALEEARECRPRLAQLHFLAGELLGKLEAPSRGVAAFGRALELAPLHWRALAERAELHYAVGEVEAAERDLRTLQAGPELSRAVCLAARILCSRGATSEALAGLTPRLGNPPDPRFLTARAEVLEAAGHHRLAEEDWNRALELAPEDPDVLLARASFLYQEDPQAADEFLERLLALSCPPPHAYLLHGDLLTRRSRVGAAEIAYRQGLERYPRHLKLLLSLAGLQLVRGELEEVESLAGLASGVEPGSPAVKRLSKLLRQQRMGVDPQEYPLEPTRSSESGLRLAPPGFALVSSSARALQDADWEHNVGLGLALSNRVEEALPHFLQATRLDPQNPLYHGNLAFAYLQLGKLEGAVRSCKKALLADPEDGWAALVLARIDLARNEPAAALERVAALPAPASLELEYHETLMEAHLALGDRSTAAVHARRCLLVGQHAVKWNLAERMARAGQVVELCADEPG